MQNRTNKNQVIRMIKTKSQNISAIVLAAGESQRMGKVNKLKLCLNEEPLIQRTVKMLLTSDIDEIVVVVGHEAMSISDQLERLQVTMVYNEDYKQGQMTSVHKGMAALNQECDGVMVCLADQPLLQKDDINQLIDAFVHRQQGTILVPTYKGQRGNPIILSSEHRDSILSGEYNLGCKRLIEKHPEFVCTVEMENNHVLVDIDTPDDFIAIQILIDDQNEELLAISNK